MEQIESRTVFVSKLAQDESWTGEVMYLSISSRLDSTGLVEYPSKCCRSS
jgi:hypothetical protein